MQSSSLPVTCYWSPVKDTLSVSAQTVEIAPISLRQFDNLRWQASGINVLESSDIRKCCARIQTALSNGF
jgi:hypothetical protein